MDVQEIITFLLFVFWIVMGLFGQKRKAQKRKQRELQQRQQKEMYGTEDAERQYDEPKTAPPIVFESESSDVDILEELLGRKSRERASKPTPVAVPVSFESSSAQFEDSIAISLKEKRIADQMKKDYQKEVLNFKLNIDETFRKKNVHRIRKGTNNRYSKVIKTDFDLRKAVIFSEILKRPHQ